MVAAALTNNPTRPRSAGAEHRWKLRKHGIDAMLSGNGQTITAD
jgi:hypothetical protein